MRGLLFNSWISLTIFIGLIIFIPYKVSLFAFKVSDLWLILCIVMQYVNGLNAKINFPHRTFIKNFGIWMGIIAIIGTIFQAWQNEIPIDPVYFSEFYRFFRYFMIFKFVENIILASDQKDFIRFFQSWTIIGVIVIFFSFLEFYSIGIVHELILRFYFIVPEQSFEEYLEEFGRLLGVLGNSNTTAIFLTSTLVFPAFSLILANRNAFHKMFMIVYILLCSFVIIVMTSSRTSIIICILLFLFLFFSALFQVKYLLHFISVVLASLILVIALYVNYGPPKIFSDRVTFLFEGKNTKGERVGFIEAMGRNELWKDRITTFNNSAHDFALFVGMGYTGVYKDYSDNGILSAFFNGGLAGLLLRLILYYLVFRYSFWRSFRNFRAIPDNYNPLILGLISMVFIFWEFTADMMEHIKIGQIFYLFFCAGFLSNALYYRRREIYTFMKEQNPQSSLAV